MNDRPASAVASRAAGKGQAPTLDEERAVVLRLKDGDREAFGTLYGWFRDPVWRTILARCPDRVQAEDALRNTFRKGLEKIAQFRTHDRSIVHWLRRIAIHEAMDVHRRAARDRKLEEAVAVEPNLPMHRPAAPDRGVEQDETKRDVDISLSRLNPRYARVLQLRLIEDRDRQEVADLLDISLGTLDVLFHRACKAFRKGYPP